jgi:hypothetical protein
VDEKPWKKALFILGVASTGFVETGPSVNYRSNTLMQEIQEKPGKTLPHCPHFRLYSE